MLLVENSLAHVLVSKKLPSIRGSKFILKRRQKQLLLAIHPKHQKRRGKKL